MQNNAEMRSKDADGKSDKQECSLPLSQYLKFYFRISNYVIIIGRLINPEAAITTAADDSLE